jgi:hypothetical protein
LLLHNKAQNPTKYSLKAERLSHLDKDIDHGIMSGTYELQYPIYVTPKGPWY